MGIVPPLWVVVLCFLYLLSTFNPVSPSRIRVPLLSRIKASSPKVKAEKHMVFFSPDIHDGTRRDLALTLYNLNQSIIFASGKCTLPGYSVVSKMQISDRVSPIPFPSILYADQRTCSSVTTRVFKEKAAKKAFRTLQQYSKASSIDAIVCVFYPAECLNYVATNKTIIFLPAHRFSLLLCSVPAISTALYWMFHSGLSHIHVVAMGTYDREFINYYTGKNVSFIYPSSMLEFTPPRRRVIRFNSVLVAPFKDRAVSLASTLNTIAKSHNSSVTFTTVQQAIKGPFSIRQLNEFIAVVVFPYAMLSYYLCDLMAAGIPMIVPSRQFLASSKYLLDYRNSGSYYCKKRVETARHPSSRHPISPEEDSYEARYYWLQYASFYTPCSVTFDSMEEIPALVKNMNVSSVYECNLRFIAEMKKHNRKEWMRIINKVEHRDMAKNYYDILRQVNRTSVYN